MTWTLGGTALDAGSVTVVVVPGSVSGQQATRFQEEAVLHGSAKRHNLGEDFTRWSITFQFLGPAPDRYDRLKVVQDLFQGNDSLELVAPSSGEFYWPNGTRTERFTLDSLAPVYGSALGSVALQVQASQVAAIDVV